MRPEYIVEYKSGRYIKNVPRDFIRSVFGLANETITMLVRTHKPFFYKNCEQEPNAPNGLVVWEEECRLRKVQKKTRRERSAERRRLKYYHRRMRNYLKSNSCNELDIDDLFSDRF